VRAINQASPPKWRERYSSEPNYPASPIGLQPLTEMVFDNGLFYRRRSG
jgi:hypothetical protein